MTVNYNYSVHNTLNMSSFLFVFKSHAIYYHLWYAYFNCDTFLNRKLKKKNQIRPKKSKYYYRI